MNLSVMSIDSLTCISIFSVLSEIATSVLNSSSSVSRLKVDYTLYLFLNADGMTSS